MGSTKALSLATVVVLGTVASAAAADLLPPPPDAGADSGAARHERLVHPRRRRRGHRQFLCLPLDACSRRIRLAATAPAFSRVFSSIGDSAIFGVGVGYQFNNWFRGDVTGEYRTSAAL